MDSLPKRDLKFSLPQREQWRLLKFWVLSAGLNEFGRVFFRESQISKYISAGFPLRSRTS